MGRCRAFFSALNPVSALAWGVHIYIYTYIHVYIYTYIYIYIHIYIYVYIYIGGYGVLSDNSPENQCTECGTARTRKPPNAQGQTPQNRGTESRSQVQNLDPAFSLHGIAKSGPVSGPGLFIFKVQVVKTFQVVPSSLGSGMQTGWSNYLSVHPFDFLCIYSSIDPYIYIDIWIDGWINT